MSTRKTDSSVSSICECLENFNTPSPEEDMLALEENEKCLAAIVALLKRLNKIALVSDKLYKSTIIASPIHKEHLLPKRKKTHHLHSV